MKADSDGLVADESGSVVGAKQMHSKILLDLFAIDEPCGKRIIDTWKDSLSATHGLKNDRPYSSLEEYVPFRIQNVAPRLVHPSTKSTIIALINSRVSLAPMLFGIGVAVTDEEFAEIEDVAFPAYAAIGLANDYFSFDRGSAERKETSNTEPMTNAVWVCMQCSDVDVAQAKELVRTKILFYEDEYLSRKSAFFSKNPASDKFRLCFDGISQMVIGHVVWSLKCPRYYPEHRYDANASVENQFLGLEMPAVEDLRTACLDLESRKLESRRDSGTNCDEDESIKHEQIANKQGSILSSNVVTAPIEYYEKDSSKETMGWLLDALNVWIQAPHKPTKTIKSVLKSLRTASLLLDDIEDQSPLRRGKPAAHIVFGVPSTINSANFAILEATEQASWLGSESLAIYFEFLRELFIGQGYELFWTKHNAAPSTDEYIAMVDGKTGALFQLFSSLLICSTNQKPPSSHQKELDTLVTLLGRLYQIRDDLQNLTSAEYARGKGSCEDLDEGKFSYPVIQALAAQDGADSALRNLYAIRARGGGKLSAEMKLLVLDEMRECGALDKTEEAIKGLQVEIDSQVSKVEGLFGQENWVLRLLLHKLRSW
jgi:ophiobolin F synthase